MRHFDLSLLHRSPLFCFRKSRQRPCAPISPYCSARPEASRLVSFFAFSSSVSHVHVSSGYASPASSKHFLF